MKSIRVILSPRARFTYSDLSQKAEANKVERSIFNAVKNKLILLKLDHHFGQPIRKELIPREYIIENGVRNLFRLELPDYWRMLYAVTNNESSTEILVIIVDILSHPDYDKKFGY